MGRPPRGAGPYRRSDQRERTLNHEQLRRRAKQIVAGIDLPRPLTPDALHRFMEQYRGVRLVISELPPELARDGVCGLWIAYEDELFERVHCVASDSAVHRQQFLNHEYGHMLLGHDRTLPSAVARLAPLVPLGAIVHALSRSDFADEEEALAEAVGDELALRMIADARERRWPRRGFAAVLR